MRQFSEQVTIKTAGRKLYDITPDVLQLTKKTAIQTGLLNILLYSQGA